MNKYLTADKYIDWDNPEVLSLAKQLSDGLSDDILIAKRCFEWVRDEIKHSSDYELNPVTCKASEVLGHRTGFCYAKSHLLAAVLRANNIPAGLCYQRVSLDSEKGPFCLHGLNAVYLKDYGWYRMDARGNIKNVNAQFIPPTEQLAFLLNEKYEKDIPGIFDEPLPQVIDALTKYKDFLDLNENLPDIIS